MKKFYSMLLLLAAVCCCAAELPDKFQVKCGDITVGVSKRSFWNLNGISFKGFNACYADTAWYGTTTSYGKGWVGSGHLENGIGEKDVQVRFFLNNAPWTPVKGVTTAKNFRYEKSSKIGSMNFKYTVELTGEKLVEKVKFTMDRNMGMTIYHYMHPWSRAFTEYLYGTADGKKSSGSFSNSKRTSEDISKPLYFASYSPAKKLGFVSVVKSPVPVSETECFHIWNRIADRKVYFVPVREKKVLTGKEYDSVMTTRFFQSEAADWQRAASEIAGK